MCSYIVRRVVTFRRLFVVISLCIGASTAKKKCSCKLSIEQRPRRRMRKRAASKRTCSGATQRPPRHTMALAASSWSQSSFNHVTPCVLRGASPLMHRREPGSCAWRGAFVHTSECAPSVRTHSRTQVYKGAGDIGSIALGRKGTCWAFRKCCTRIHDGTINFRRDERLCSRYLDTGEALHVHSKHGRNTAGSDGGGGWRVAGT